MIKKVLTSLISHSTKRRDKRGIHFDNTNSDFALEVSFSKSLDVLRREDFEGSLLYIAIFKLFGW